MEWKIFFTAFSAIFLAELGDKTQLANLSLAGKSSSWISVFLGSVIAFAVVTLLTVFLGSALSKFIKPEIIRYTAASLFIIVGTLIFLGKL